MIYIKRFLEWIKIKEGLHFSSFKPPLVRERDLWWVNFGENIGSEINGKSYDFSRPGLILKKLSNTFFLVAPTTTKPKTGSWYVKIIQNSKVMFVCLHQVRSIDYRRLSNRLGTVDEQEYKYIKEAFWELYK